MNQGPPFRSYRFDIGSPKGILSILTFALVAVLAFAFLIVLLPAAILAGWYLRRKARKAMEQAQTQGTPLDHSPHAHTGDPATPQGQPKVLDASEYKVE